MRVLLVGNTCNMHLPFLSYLLDHGIDAELCLFADEGSTSNKPIHNPEWDIPDLGGDLKGRIRRISIDNSPKAIFRILLSSALKGRLSSDMRSFFSSYDIVVGGGVLPSIFFLLGIKLDVFFPYSSGIEWMCERENLAKLKRFDITWLPRVFIFWTQYKGISLSRRVANCSLSSTKRLLDALGIRFDVLMLPQYRKYINGSWMLGVSTEVKSMIDDIDKKSSDHFQIFCFTRHFYNKRLAYVIQGLSIFLKSTRAQDCIVYFVEWGAHVEDSKRLIAELGIEDNVVWLPLLPRYVITHILNRYAEIGVGEFIDSPGEFWGSTCYECLDSGVPVLQRLNFTEKEFEFYFGMKPPHIHHVENAVDAAYQIDAIYKNYQFYKQKALENVNWSARYLGNRLTEKWICLFEEIYAIKRLQLAQD